MSTDKDQLEITPQELTKLQLDNKEKFDKEHKAEWFEEDGGKAAPMPKKLITSPMPKKLNTSPPTPMKTKEQVEQELFQAETAFYSLSKKRHGKRRQRLWNVMECLKWVLGKEKQ